MQIEPWVPPCVFFDWSFSPWEFWGYWLVHIVPLMGLQTTSSPWVISLAPSLETIASPMDGCEHLLLHFSGTDRASQETALSGSCQLALVGIQNIVWDWWFFYDLDSQVGQSLDGHSFSLCSELYLCNSFNGYFVPHSKKNQSIHSWAFLPSWLSCVLQIVC